MPVSKPTPLVFAKARDGAPLGYRILSGSGVGRIALTHSLAMDHRFWDVLTPHLTAAGEVLVWDCRGHGASAKSPGPYTCEQFADDLADVLDAAGWDRCVVAGASMGGCVTLAFAAAHPERVMGVGLIDTTAWYGVKAPEQWEERAQKAVVSGLAVLVDFQKSRWFSLAFIDAHPEIVDSAVQAFLDNDLDAYVETCRMLGRFDKRDALAGFAFPTRIVVGSDDKATPPAMAKAMQIAIPGATLKIIDGGAHLTPIECPELVAGDLTLLMTNRA